MTEVFKRVSLLLLLLAGPLPGRAQAVKDLPRPTNYVSDFARVLSAATVQQLNVLCGELDHEAKAQFAIVTVKTTNGDAISDYAVELEEAWKVGPKGSNRGVILLLATQDRKYWINTGYGLEGILPDSRVGQIGRAMVPYLRSNDYDQAVTSAASSIAQIIAQDANVTLTPMTRHRPQPQQVRLSLGQLVALGVFLLLLVLLLARAGGGGLLGFLLGMFIGRGGRWGGGGGFGGGDGGGDGGGFGGFGGGESGGGGAGGSW